MHYRPEIDGLRAVALLPVILFHAGFQTFSGGFIGVDVFFVISGYLITSIILAELEAGKFSIVNFYERRARRLLPALFVVMGASCIFAYAWMLPDDLENFGQSLFATATFSNNILLAITSGYWSLDAEFKPLRHTWSLGVEEQYYLIIPLLLVIGHTLQKSRLLVILYIIFFASLASAGWASNSYPYANFYLLPTRLWELLLGSLVAFHWNRNSAPCHGRLFCSLASLTGLLLILGAATCFDALTPTPSAHTLIPTIGSVLVILYAREGIFIQTLLSNRLVVGIGLISYGTYLWHWLLFAFARIYAATPPPRVLMTFLAIASLGLAYVSWRYIETPLRSRNRFDRRHIAWYAIAITSLLAGIGCTLHFARGFPSRLYYSSEVVPFADMKSTIDYNRRVFDFKKDFFEFDSRQKILVAGRSLGRDFVNMVLENFDLASIELIYRDDFGECIDPSKDGILTRLYDRADVIVFANWEPVTDCVKRDIQLVTQGGKEIFYAGIKHFGHNLNWLMRLPPEARANNYNQLLTSTVESEKRTSSIVPREKFLSMLAPIVVGNKIPITDEEGRLLSPDRVHLTVYGARYMGRKVLVASSFGDVIRFRRIASH